MKFDNVSKEKLTDLLAFIHGDQNFLQDNEMPSDIQDDLAYVTTGTSVSCRTFSLILPPQIMPQTDGIAGSGFKYQVNLKIRQSIQMVCGKNIACPRRILDKIHEILVK